MGMGGGLFQTETKILPGAYFNFKTSPYAQVLFSERGVVAVPMVLDFQGTELIHLQAEDGTDVNAFNWPEDSLKLFGYHENHKALRPIREIFHNAKELYIYPVGTPTQASNRFGKAVKGGIRGNSLTTVVNTSIDSPSKFDVLTFLDGELVDKQTVANADELKDNAFVQFTASGALEQTASTPFTGGLNAIPTGVDYIKALNAFEGVSFNILACPVTDNDTKKIFVAWSKRLNESIGQWHQLVVHNLDKVDSEYIINVVNDVTDVNKASLVYYVAGELAGLRANEVSDNRKYKGEYEILAKANNQAELRNSIIKGEYLYYVVDGSWRVLADNNSLVTFEGKKGEPFRKNQTIRVLQQRAIDVTRIFRDEFLGKAGTSTYDRDNFKARLIDHSRHLEKMGAIRDFDVNDITVTVGAQIDSYKIEEYLRPNYAVSKIYNYITVL